jgi:hypothetical protein
VLVGRMDEAQFWTRTSLVGLCLPSDPSNLLARVRDPDLSHFVFGRMTPAGHQYLITTPQLLLTYPPIAGSR